MSGYDYIEFLTRKTIDLLLNPKRKDEKIKEHWSTKWFGQIPFALKSFFK